MPGFPPIDRFYYERPSLRLAGYLALCVSVFERDLPTFDLRPNERPYSRLKPRHFDSFKDLQQQLLSSHLEHHYYRGQNRRYSTQYSGEVASLKELDPRYSPLVVKFEALIPSLMRSVVSNGQADWDQYDYPTIIDALSPAIRAIALRGDKTLKNLLRKFFDELGHIAMERSLLSNGILMAPHPNRISSTNIWRRFAELTAISQHYELHSGMVDITTDPEVALWFASHKWDGTPVRFEEPSVVVYRFDSQSLTHAFQKEFFQQTPARLDIQRAGMFGVVRSADFEFEILRLNRQKGGAVMGLENSLSWYIIDTYSSVDIFTSPPPENQKSGLTLDHLAPRADPLIELFAPELASDRRPIESEELEYLGRCVDMSNNHALMMRLARKERLI
jgi:hypothetical protein